MLVLGALEYAVWTCDVRDGQLVHHSDRGSTYTAIRFANRLADNGIAQSMGSVGDSYDNALMENFFSTLKTELVYRNSWRTREDAENALFAYIDSWYNTQRIQKKLGWRSPDEYEAIYRHRVPAGTRQFALRISGEPQTRQSRRSRTGRQCCDGRYQGVLPAPHQFSATGQAMGRRCRQTLLIGAMLE